MSTVVEPGRAAPVARVGVAGTGFMASAHVEALRRIGVPVVAVLGSSLERARAFAATHGIARAFADLAAWAGDLEVDAVHVTTPNHLHLPQVEAALRAGKHVLCEKPLALDSRESAALVRLAEQAGVQTAVNYNVRFYPLCLEARARLAAGEIGRVHGVVGRYVQDWLLRREDYNWRVEARRGGKLRAVADIGTHWLDLVTWMTGLEVEAVCADLHTVWPERVRPADRLATFQSVGADADGAPVAVDTEDQAAVLLRFRGGARGVLWVSQMTAGRKNHLEYELAGASGSLSWVSERPEQLWIGARDRPNQVLVKDPALLRAEVRPFAAYPGGHAEGFPDTFAQLFRAFYARVAAARGRAPGPLFEGGPVDALPSFSDGHRELLLCEAIARSHAIGGWVRVEV